MQKLAEIAGKFNRMAETKYSPDQFQNILESRLPLPTKPRNVDRHPGSKTAYETRLVNIETARKEITYLIKAGMGRDREISDDTLWGALSAVTEYVDHRRTLKGDRISYALLSDGRELKLKAYNVIQQQMVA